MDWSQAREARRPPRDPRIGGGLPEHRVSGRLSGIGESREDDGREVARFVHHRVGLNLLHVGRGETAAPCQALLEQLGDAAGANAGVERRAEVQDAAVRPELVERDRCRAWRRSGRCWQLTKNPRGGLMARGISACGKNLERQCVGSALVPREPLIAPLPVAKEHRGQASHFAGLQVLPQRHLAAQEVGDVAVHFRAREVLRADVEELERLPNSSRLRARIKPRKASASRVPPEPAYCTLIATPCGEIELHDRALVPARHDQHRGRNPSAGGLDAQSCP